LRSPYQRKALDRLLWKDARDGRQSIVQALEKLLEFPGLWDEFTLGNFEGYLALHCAPEMSCFIKHIELIWTEITLHDPEIRKATCPDTVRGLQLLAPAASVHDQDVVKKLMRSRAIFSRITNPDSRGRIEAAILRINVVIPSFKTFHENMKYLSIGACIIKDNILPKLRPDQTLFCAMEKIWRRPDRCLIEYREGEYVEWPYLPNMRLAYQIAFVSALRDFPAKSKHRPRREPGEQPESASSDRSHFGFLRQLQAVGFQVNGPELTGSDDLPEEPAAMERSEEAELKRRCGRPFERSFRYIRSHLFIPELVKDQGVGTYPTTLFIQRDFLRSFLGDLALLSNDGGSRQTPAPMRDVIGQDHTSPSVSRQLDNTTGHLGNPLIRPSQEWEGLTLLNTSIDGSSLARSLLGEDAHERHEMNTNDDMGSVRSSRVPIHRQNAVSSHQVSTRRPNTCAPTTCGYDDRSSLARSLLEQERHSRSLLQQPSTPPTWGYGDVSSPASSLLTPGDIHEQDLTFWSQHEDNNALLLLSSAAWALANRGGRDNSLVDRTPWFASPASQTSICRSPSIRREDTNGTLRTLISPRGQ
jgi:hypothetical protein